MIFIPTPTFFKLDTFFPHLATMYRTEEPIHI
jgi:hypothetical protein